MSNGPKYKKGKNAGVSIREFKVDSCNFKQGWQEKCH